MTDFSTIEYLKSGNSKQQLAYTDLTENNVIGILSGFNPLLAGTIPIEIDIDNSDLDIVCQFTNKTAFRKILTNNFGKKPGFELFEKKMLKRETVIARFNTRHFQIEIFAQNYPSCLQNAFRHMLIEHHIIKQKGAEFKQKIIDLKKAGYKTEPAFAKLLGLKGDPYIELLNYEMRESF